MSRTCPTVLILSLDVDKNVGHLKSLLLEALSLPDKYVGRPADHARHFELLIEEYCSLGNTRYEFLDALEELKQVATLKNHTSE